MRIFASIGIAAGLTLTGVIAQADVPPAVIQTCGVELRQLCPLTSDTELRQCVRASSGRLSPACKQALADAHLKLKEIKREDINAAAGLGN